MSFFILFAKIKRVNTELFETYIRSGISLSILVHREDQVGIIRINRPEALNALNTSIMKQIAETMEKMDRDEEVRVIVLTGNDRAFAAGADIKELAQTTAVDFVMKQFFADWNRIRKITKPVIAAVSGFALGGGCELAMCCDLIIASESAQFGQPEINIGVMPGAGGTQRLTRAIGKNRAMELILTGRSLNAQEALSYGLVNRVVPKGKLDEEALQLAQEIASKPPMAVRLAKQAVVQSEDLSLEQGLQFEQHLFYLLFASEDQKEGMNAFMEKRRPAFQGA